MCLCRACNYPQFLLLIDGRSWVMGACADSDVKRSFDFLPNFPPRTKQKRRQRRREKPGVAGGGEPGDGPRTGKSTREIYLSAELVEWTACVNRRICSAASIEIIYGAAGFFFSRTYKFLPSCCKRGNPSTYRSSAVTAIQCFLFTCR